MENQETETQVVEIIKGDEVTFTPCRKTARAEQPLIGVATKVFTNKEGKKYVSIKVGDKNYQKRFEKVTKV